MEIAEVREILDNHMKDLGYDLSEEARKGADIQTILIGKIWAALAMNEDLSNEEILGTFDDLLRKLCLDAMGYKTHEEYRMDYFLKKLLEGDITDEGNSGKA